VNYLVKRPSGNRQKRSRLPPSRPTYHTHNLSHTHTHTPTPIPQSEIKLEFLDDCKFVSSQLRWDQRISCVLASAKETESELERREKEKEKTSAIGRDDKRSAVEKEKVGTDDDNVKEKESEKEKNKEKEKEKEEVSPKSLKDQIGFLSALVKVWHCVTQLHCSVE
jgi:hypothetical protein